MKNKQIRQNLVKKHNYPYATNQSLSKKYTNRLTEKYRLQFYICILLIYFFYYS